MQVQKLLLVGALLTMPLTATADPWKDESGHGHRYERDYKHEYWDGHCKVKREYKNGKYKEKRECSEPSRYHRYHHHDDSYYSNEPRIIIDPVIHIGGWWD